MRGVTSPLSPALVRRAQELSDAIFPLLLEALREGRQVGAGRFADSLLHFAAARLATAERQYAQLDDERVAALEDAYRDGTHSPVVEAYFGAMALVLNDLRDEIRRLRPLRPASAGEG